jgi:hypothetical protein
MNSFTLADCTTVEAALSQLKDGAVVKAAGVDLLDRMLGFRDSVACRRRRRIALAQANPMRYRITQALQKGRSLSTLQPDRGRWSFVAQALA